MDAFTATTPSPSDTFWFLLAKATASAYALCVAAGFTDVQAPMNGDTELTLLRKLATALDTLATGGLGGGGFAAGAYLGDDRFDTIQQAINEAATDDTIEVMAGTYPEAIQVTKSLKINCRPGVVIAPTASQNAFTLSDTVALTLSGLKYDGSPTAGGILLNATGDAGCSLTLIDCDINTYNNNATDTLVCNGAESIISLVRSKLTSEPTRNCMARVGVINNYLAFSLDSVANTNPGTGFTVSGLFVDSAIGTYAKFDYSMNDQTGVSYTLTPNDNGKIVTLSNAAAITLTVPASLPLRFSCVLIQKGAGQFTVTASGTTINSYGSLVKSAGQFAAATLSQVSANVFNLSGALTA